MVAIKLLTLLNTKISHNSNLSLIRFDRSVKLCVQIIILTNPLIYLFNYSLIYIYIFFMMLISNLITVNNNKEATI